MSKRLEARVWLTGVLSVVFLIGLMPVAASSANISRSYKSSGQIPNGSIVSLDSGRSDYIEPTNTNNSSRILGVVVPENDSLLAVDPAAGKAQVATSGTASVLVTSVNGAINVGDQVAVSPFSGIGMKAAPGSKVIGLAQNGFNDNSPNAITQQVADKTGKSNPVKIGYVKLTISTGTNSNNSGDLQLNSLQKFAKSFTGKVISTPRIVASMLIAFAALIALVTLTYASIYGSIISVGRNPLAKHSIFRTLGSVLVMVVLTAVTATGMIIFLLR